MSPIAKAQIAQLTKSVTAQLTEIETLRFAVTERQADSANHREQDELQAQLDIYTAVAANLNRALEELAA
jgi:hypothetical protein